MTNQEIKIKEKRILGVDELKTQKEWEDDGFQVKPWCKDDAHNIKLWYGNEKEVEKYSKDQDGNEIKTKDVQVIYKKQNRKMYDEGQVFKKET